MFCRQLRWIIAPRVPGMAAKNPLHPPPTSPQCPVFAHRLDEIGTTGGLKTAMPAKHRAEHELIYAHQADQHQARHGHHQAPQSAGQRARHPDIWLMDTIGFVHAIGFMHAFWLTNAIWFVNAVWLMDAIWFTNAVCWFLDAVEVCLGLHGRTLPDVNLTGVNLTGVNLPGVNLPGVIPSGMNWYESAGAESAGAEFAEAESAQGNLPASQVDTTPRLRTCKCITSRDFTSFQSPPPGIDSRSGKIIRLQVLSIRPTVSNRRRNLDMSWPCNPG